MTTSTTSPAQRYALDGRRAWAVRYRIGGRTRKHSVGHWPAIDLATARQLAAKALRAVAEGSDPGHAKSDARAAPPDTVGRVVEERLEGHMFGEERLLELLRQSAGLSAAGIAGRIERAVLEFKPGPPADDVAVIVLRLTGNE